MTDFKILLAIRRACDNVHPPEMGDCPAVETIVGLPDGAKGDLICRDDGIPSIEGSVAAFGEEILFWGVPGSVIDYRVGRSGEKRSLQGLVNLTPHAIHIVGADGADGSVVLTVPPSGILARCTTSRKVVGSLTEDWVTIPITRTVFGAVEGLPDPASGFEFIVSSLVAQAARERTDLLIPDDTIRDAEGRIIGCRALARL